MYYRAGESPHMLHFCQWLEHNSFILWLDSNVVLSLVLEIMHYSGFFLLVGSTAIVDLRVMGLAGRNEQPSGLAEQFRPWMWTGFCMALFSGFFMFSADAVDFYLADWFRYKIIVVLLALIFGALMFRKVRRSGEAQNFPAAVKLAAFVSLIFWIGSILVSVEVPAISGVG
jgi:uncharacterized membrane protein SirB2